MIVCLVDLDETSMRAIFKALADVVTAAAKSSPIIAVNVFDAISLVVSYISLRGVCAERTLLLDDLKAIGI